MAGKEPDTGPTSATVAANVRRLRSAQELTYTQLSERLKQLADWSISPVGVRRLEDGERRISVDDLVALAVALRVSPVTLLMPDVLDTTAAVAATGTGERPAESLWRWLTADNPLKGSGYRTSLEFWLNAWPEWWQHRASEEIANRRRRLKDARDRAYGAEREGSDDGDN